MDGMAWRHGGMDGVGGREGGEGGREVRRENGKEEVREQWAEGGRGRECISKGGRESGVEEVREGIIIWVEGGREGGRVFQREGGR